MERREIAIIGILFSLTLLSLIMPLNSPTGYMGKLPAGAEFPTCSVDAFSGDIASCHAKYGNIVLSELSKLETEIGTEIDPNYIYSIILQESSCRDSERLKKDGVSTWKGGIMQVDYGCNDRPDDNPCTIEEQFEKGFDVFKSEYKKVLSQNSDVAISGQEIMALILFSYNRGSGTASKAIEYVNRGDDVVIAMTKACKEIYYKKCAGTDPYCALDSNNHDKCTWSGYGVRYPERVFSILENSCEASNGKFENYDGNLLDYALADSQSGFFTRKDLFARAAGSYSFRLTFSTFDEFDLSIFKKIQDDMRNLTEECSMALDKKNCTEEFINNKNKNTQGLKLGPQDPQEDAIFSLVEQLNLCRNSSTMGQECYCEIELKEPIELYEDIKISYDSNFNLITFEKDVGDKTIRYEMPYSFPIYNLIKIQPLQKYSPLIEKRIGNKTYLKKMGASFYILDSFDRANPNPPKKCEVDQKFYVLTKKTGKEFIYYDKDEQKHVIGKPDIEFAIYLKDITPPEPTEFKVEQIDQTNNTIYISWEKPSGNTDIDKYYIFYSPTEFNDNPYDVLNPSDSDFETNITFMDLSNASLIDQSYADYEEITIQPLCEDLDSVNSYCNFEISVYDESIDDYINETLDKNKIYGFYGFDKYLAVLELPKREYHITVLAMDKSGNIESFVNAKKAVIKTEDLQRINPISLYLSGKEPLIKRIDSDHIEVDFTNVELKNFDETIATDLNSYWFYIENQNNLKNSKTVNLNSLRPAYFVPSQKIKDVVPVSDNSCFYILPMDMEYFSVQGKYSQIFTPLSIYNEISVDLKQFTCI
ncbi:hypothetical protein C0585_00365 [Candidatus Woesearchaeota archaeon]|nr:MAG: hypothetical protein C0585_00365 [Candidatus Woesearchaeota archaeon]